MRFFCFHYPIYVYTEYVHIEMKEEPMSITINGQTSPATEFAWDGCHKIYLLDNGDADKNGKYGVHALQERRSRIQGAASLGTTARYRDPILPAPLHQQLGARQEIMFPNATRSPSPSKRVEREKP